MSNSMWLWLIQTNHNLQPAYWMLTVLPLFLSPCSCIVVSVAYRRWRQTVNTHAVLIWCLKSPFHKLIDSSASRIKQSGGQVPACHLSAVPQGAHCSSCSLVSSPAQWTDRNLVGLFRGANESTWSHFVKYLVNADMILCYIGSASSGVYNTQLESFLRTSPSWWWFCKCLAYKLK